ncbi:shikimate dehydrogenase [Corynebacterium sp. CCM 9203]|uniref:shikimate dehydrogenase n=1 Tax=Corynebacterium sp. CCM 9203 TaxID=3057615 RepID=UPI00352671DD
MSIVIRHKVAVLGQPVEHSLSPVIHTAGYRAAELHDWAYSRIDCSAEDLPGLVATAGHEYVGFSVTMPGKFAALSFADEATSRATAIGSANTLVRTRNGWRADNTDCEGVLAALDALGIIRVEGSSRAVLVGAGGTARPALWALGQAGFREVTLINRSDRSAEFTNLASNLGINLQWCSFDTEAVRKAARGATVVISTVPANAAEGLAGSLAQAPIVDVIYDPWPTPLAVAALNSGVPVVGGDIMLLGQALSQFEQFTAVRAPREAMREALEQALAAKGMGV